jgi:transcriptional regulator with GAF, ATPase, and Fis domain
MASIGGAAIENTRRFHKLDLVRETLEDENRALKQRMLRDYSDRLMVGDSPKMQRVIDLVARVADSQASVLIRGESGTGKEMVARLIHGNSPRKDGPFVAINCAALPETLLESELFGIERGVATGVEARPGKFELAKGGTIFLDEIGDIPLRDASQSRGDDREVGVPPGSLLSVEGRRDLPPAAARAEGGHPQARPLLPRQVRQARGTA